MKIKNLMLAACCLGIVCFATTSFAQSKSKFVQVQDTKVELSSLKKNAKGAYILFDGTSLNGWRGYDQSAMPKDWQIVDGNLVLSAKKEGESTGRGDVIFDQEFKNFELELEWKVSKGANSGIFFLAKETPGKPIYISAPEYQVLDNENHPDAKLGVDGNRKSASLYDMIPAKPQNAKPYGEWNSTKIVVKDGQVQHWQNGVKVVQYSLWDQSWVDMLQKSKFSEAKWPDAFALLKNVGGEKHQGLIGLQDHGDEVAFRNITVKVLK